MPRWKPDPRHIARPPDNKCNGKVRGRNSTDHGDKAYCPKGAGHGTDHAGIGRCKHHGGAAPTYAAEVALLKAQQEMAVLDKGIIQYGLPVEADPHQALLDELYRTIGHVGWLRRRVGELETDDMYGPVGGGQGGHPSAEAHIWIRLYQEERKHLKSVAKTCIDAGISERQIRIAEQQAQMFAGALQVILTKLGVIDHPEAPKVVREALLELEQGADGSFGVSEEEMVQID